jgi:hypothetical protein
MWEFVHFTPTLGMYKDHLKTLKQEGRYLEKNRWVEQSGEEWEYQPEQAHAQ